MSLASRIKPISYFKANAAEIIKELGEVGEPMIITQNGEAKAVVQDIVSRKGVLIACNPDRDLHFDCTLTLVYLYLNILPHKEHRIRPHRLTSWAFDNCAGFQVEARAVGAAGYD